MKIHVVYKITNKINGKIYIGKFSGLEETFKYYYGSGLAILRALKKYGRENFTKETLFKFSTEREAYDREVEIVTEKFLRENKTYNLTVGGEQGGTKVMKALWKDKKSKVYSPEFLEKRQKSQKAAKSTLESREHQSEITKAAWENPDSGLNSVEREKKLRATHRALRDDPDSVYNSPDFHKKSIEELQSKEHREASSKRMKRAHADPNSKLNLKIKSREYKKQCSEASKKGWETRRRKQDGVSLN